VFDYVPFREHEITSLRTAFNALDTDEDGHINRAEALALATTAGIFGKGDAKVAAEKYLTSIDLVEADDTISWEPFLFSVGAAYHKLGGRGTPVKRVYNKIA
jgi:Ca2+-binding EF-hand superfamily protein